MPMTTGAAKRARGPQLVFVIFRPGRAVGQCLQRANAENDAASDGGHDQRNGPPRAPFFHDDGFDDAFPRNLDFAAAGVRHSGMNPDALNVPQDKAVGVSPYEPALQNPGVAAGGPGRYGPTDNSDNDMSIRLERCDLRPLASPTRGGGRRRGKADGDDEEPEDNAAEEAGIVRTPSTCGPGCRRGHPIPLRS